MWFWRQGAKKTFVPTLAAALYPYPLAMYVEPDG
jgi:hypothetical protein